MAKRKRFSGEEKAAILSSIFIGAWWLGMVGGCSVEPETPAPASLGEQTEDEGGSDPQSASERVAPAGARGVNIFFLEDESMSLKAALTRPLDELVLQSTPWISSEMFERYDASSHCMDLDQSYEFPGNGETYYGIPFVVTADGQPCYLGGLISVLSSWSPDLTTPVIRLLPGPGGATTLETLLCVEPAGSRREDPDVMRALRRDGQFHAGLEASLDRVEVRSRGDASEVTYTYTLKNVDEDALYVRDPDRVGAHAFHYYTNPPRLRSEPGQTWHVIRADTVGLTVPQPEQDVDPFRRLLPQESITRTVTAVGYPKIPPGEYVSSFYFRGCNTRPGGLDSCQRADGVVWVGGLRMTQTCEVTE